MTELQTRAQVPVEQTWDLTHLFPTVEAWEAELEAVGDDLGGLAWYRGRLGESGQTLLACLNVQEDLNDRMMRVASYAWFSLSTDATSPHCQAMAGRVGALRTRVQAETSFVQSEIRLLPAGTLERFMTDEPGLSGFRRMLERVVAAKQHALSPETEHALASLGEVLDAPEMIYERSKASDMAFEPVKDGNGAEHRMSFATYENRFERSADQVLRRRAWESFTKGLKAYRNTYAATWASEVKKQVVVARLRGYGSAIDHHLATQEISREVFDSLHHVILTELAPHMRRYAALRKQLLGLDRMLYVDIEAPLDPDFAPVTTFGEAAGLIQQGLTVLGPEYAEMIRASFRDRWIDWAANVGKSTGAAANPVYGVHPYIRIVWTDSMRNVLVLAHELGHAGQIELLFRNNRWSNSLPSGFFIEAPSTINELLIGQQMLDGATDPRLRRWVAMQLLTTYHHNFVRHVIESELQRRMYALAEKGQTITADTLSAAQGAILQEFWGDLLELDDGARLTWMRQPHYYMGLHAYTYSAGLTIGTVVAEAIRREGAPAANRWIEVLKIAGLTKPLELARMAGVDMADPETIRRAIRYVGTLVDEVVTGFQE